MYFFSRLIYTVTPSNEKRGFLYKSSLKLINVCKTAYFLTVTYAVTYIVIVIGACYLR